MISQRTKIRTREWILAATLLFAVVLPSGGCGYRLRSAAGKLPQGIQSLGIPTFKNLTTQYKIEQILANAVLREFSLRTQVRINSNESSVDAVLVGEIRNISSTPVTFGSQTVGSQTFGSTFMITVEMAVKLIRLSDSSVIWENSRYVFREQYVLNANLKDFFSEENPALERLARSFAASLVSTVLDRSAL